MNKLKNKVFFTIFSILTISVLSFIIVFNVQNYIEQKFSVINSLRIVSKSGRKEDNKDTKSDLNSLPPDKPEVEKEIKPVEPKEQKLNENIKFMDSVIYTILIDSNDDIKEVINHSNNELSDENIRDLAVSILKNENLKEEYVGCLYFENYSYTYLKGNSLIILDNSNIKKSLILSLESSIVIFIILEIIILFISKLITNWITKPVKISFDKQKQFIADASHELKTPLSVIIASSEALEDSPKEKKWLKNIRNEADRMNLLITNLLELSASEGEKIEQFQVSNLSKIVELSVLTFEGKAYEKKIKINYKIDENIKFKMNENSIKQLVEILLDNAVKHSNEKSVVDVSLKSLNNNIELSIENNGEEIPKEEEKKIFERFYRIDKSRDRKENRYGLGLAIAKNIVENHNGKISVSSNNGITIFKVLFKK